MLCARLTSNGVFKQTFNAGQGLEIAYNGHSQGASNVCECVCVCVCVCVTVGAESTVIL